MSETDNSEIFKKVLDGYLTAMNISTDLYAAKKKNLRLPTMPLSAFKALCEESQKIFSEEPLLLHAESPIIIVGDLHGHILDLFRLLKQHRCPPFQKYLFLGDYVDRGEFSTEIIILLFLLKRLYPENVYMLRGNHEFREIFSSSGFSMELIKVFKSTEAVDAIEQAFNYMPLACDIDGYIFCCHGGIGPNFVMTDQLRTITRPITDFTNPVVDDIVWSDPSESVEEYDKSPRYQGHLYGQKAVQMFLDSNMYRFLIRGHQAVESGVQYLFGCKTVTVFSASSYCGEMENNSGFVTVNENLYFDKIVYPPIAYLKRNDASFFSPSTKVPKPPVPDTSSTPPRPRNKITKAQSAKTMPQLESFGSELTDVIESLPSYMRPRNTSRRMGPGSLERPLPPRLSPRKIVTPKVPRK